MGKNWKAICALSNPEVMFVLSRIKEDDPLFENLRGAFPDCFTGPHERVPIPWSELKKAQLEQFPDIPAEVETEILDEYYVPYQLLTSSEELLAEGVTWGRIPLGLKAQWRSPGTIVEHKGGRFLVVQRWKDGDDGHECLTIVPVECIDLNA